MRGGSQWQEVPPDSATDDWLDVATAVAAMLPATAAAVSLRHRRMGRQALAWLEGRGVAVWRDGMWELTRYGQRWRVER